MDVCIERGVEHFLLELNWKCIERDKEIVTRAICLLIETASASRSAVFSVLSLILGVTGRTRVLSGELQLKKILMLKRTYHFSFVLERICCCSFIVLNL